MRRLLLMLAGLLLWATPLYAQATGPWAKVIFGSDTGPFDTSGTGSPENVMIGCPGSTYRQTDGTSGNVFWVKDGDTDCDATGWVVVGSGGGGGSTHNLLSTTHADTSTAAALRGALVVGNATPAWSRLALGAAGTVLRSDGTDAGWSHDGSLLEDLNASEITSGTLPDARLSSNVSLLGATIGTSEIEDDAITFAKIGQNGCASNQIPKWNGSDWACATDETGAGGGGSNALLDGTNHTDTAASTANAGDLIFANASDFWDDLAIGSEGEVLKVVSGLPSWEPDEGSTCQQGEFDTSHTGATLTVDWDNGAQQIVDLDADLTSLTLSNGVDGCTYRLLFVQDGTGGHTVTWPSGVEFENDTAPTFDTTANNVTFCSLVKTAVGNGGYLGFCTENPIDQP